MKILVLTFATLFFVSCNENSNEVDTEYMDDVDENTEVVLDSSDHPLKGAWELTGYYNYENDKVIDSFDQRDGFRQVKMYSDSKVMWSKMVPTDSTEWFGYGSYKIVDGQLIEVLDYGSRMMTKIIQEREEFTYDLQINGDTFSQIEIDEEGNKIYSENYRKIE